jgi:hypothetical protein
MSKYPPDAPLRLDVAVREAFPAGGMTVSGLRREAARGRLVIEVIAGKHFTTLAAIARMRELCRREPPTQLSQDDPSVAALALTAQAALRARLGAPKSK